jgi:hypothetical protein
MGWIISLGLPELYGWLWHITQPDCFKWIMEMGASPV